MSRSSIYAKIYEIIRKIPWGKVATYGQIARLAELPGHARQVGYALHALPEESKVPWHRVINAKGQISLRTQDVSSSIQKVLLEKEGVAFNENNRVSLKCHGWLPNYRAKGGKRPPPN